jgi:hypothetical protein
MMGIRFQLLTPHLTVGEFKHVGSMSRGERLSVLCDWVGRRV